MQARTGQQTDKHTQTHADAHTDRTHTNKRTQTDTHTHRHTHRQTHRHRQTHTHRHTHFVSVHSQAPFDCAEAARAPRALNRCPVGITHRHRQTHADTHTNTDTGVRRASFTSSSLYPKLSSFARIIFGKDPVVTELPPISKHKRK